MLRESLHSRQKPQVFQALFLKNDKTQEVEVFEDEHIDFELIQKHLDNGGSIFITSKSSQKLRPGLPKRSSNLNFRKNKIKTVKSYCKEHS